LLTKALKDQSGYSLVEVMVSILILTVAIIPMVGMFDAGLRAAVIGGNYDKARALANKQLEDVKALDYDDVVSRYTPGETPVSCDEGIFDCEVTTDYVVLVTTGTDTAEFQETVDPQSMMKVTVTVGWEGKSYSTAGVIAK
jgi:prepilin-type N-terminal cleavage/methylation domain-containing protein